MSSEDECLSPLMSIRPGKSSLLMRTPVLAKPEHPISSNVMPVCNSLKEQLDLYKTPEIVSNKKLTAAFLFSSCKKNRKSDVMLRHNTILVGDSSEDEEQFQYSAKYSNSEKGLSYVVDEPITEFSLIRKWLLATEDSSASETENLDDVLNGSLQSSLLEKKKSTILKNKNESIVLLSSSDEEKNDLEHSILASQKQEPHVLQTILKGEADSSVVCDSFPSASPISSLHEKLKKTINNEQELVSSTSSEDDEAFSPLTSTKLLKESFFEIPETPEKDNKLPSIYFKNPPGRLSKSPNEDHLTSLEKKLNSSSFRRTTNTSTTRDAGQTSQEPNQSVKPIINDLFVESSDEENIVPLSRKISTWKKRQKHNVFESSDEEQSNSIKNVVKMPDLLRDSESRFTSMPTRQIFRSNKEADLEDMFVSLTVTETPVSKPKKTSKPRRKMIAAYSDDNLNHTKGPMRSSFLSSLSVNHPAESRHPEALPFIRSFKKTRDELTRRLFELFNETVFDNQLQRDFSITWNNRLTRTAGYCRHFTRRENGAMFFESRIELSVKVVDTPCRLRDTLVHELCHAATWTIDNCRGGHGPMWRRWANRALTAFPELPPITRCHNYEISYKYYYNCTVCSFSTGRHSKSVDTMTHVCPMCRGRIDLSKEPNKAANSGEHSESAARTLSVPKTPRTPNPFAMFVKENYASVKSSKTDMPHAAVMKVLSVKFAEFKKQSV